MIADNVILGSNTSIPSPELVNIYGCRIGDGTKIGPFVEIQKNAEIGSNCKISSHTFVCEGVHIADRVFIGHGVIFTNDSFPRSTNKDGTLQGDDDWDVVDTYVHEGASIGSGATILPGLTIGAGATVGAGAVVVKDVPPRTIVAGNPAVVLRETPDG